MQTWLYNEQYSHPSPVLLSQWRRWNFVHRWKECRQRLKCVFSHRWNLSIEHQHSCLKQKQSVKLPSQSIRTSSSSLLISVIISILFLLCRARLIVLLISSVLGQYFNTFVFMQGLSRRVGNGMYYYYCIRESDYNQDLSKVTLQSNIRVLLICSRGKFSYKFLLWFVVLSVSIVLIAFWMNAISLVEQLLCW